jgi:uncharacterized membrane protein YhaH (DUF805 family)
MMSFPEAIATCFRKYAEFSGRAGRAEFWWWVLFVVLSNAVLNALWIPVGNGITLGGSISGAWSLVILLPSLAVLVRRLRDGDHPWGHVFWLLFPLVGTIVLIVLTAQPSREHVERLRPSQITEDQLDSLPSMPVSPLGGAGVPVAPTPSVAESIPEEPEDEELRKNENGRHPEG